MAHEIMMLGTGNAFLPNGRHHSFAIIDNRHIIDSPPTALISMRERGFDVSDIETIFITHLHGDHIFGIPFLLLERTYISDRNFDKPLTIVAAPGAKERIEQLCNIAYPGSLDRILNVINWCEDESGITSDGWSWQRFRVLHDESVDPYGYKFESPKGASFVHSGDSGPYEELYNAIENTQLVVIEMGIPEWVNSKHHHKPSDIHRLAELNPSTKLVVTHTFIDDKNSKWPKLIESTIPNHPENVHHASDGDRFIWKDDEWIKNNQ